MSSIPVVAIGLTQGLGTALAALAWIVGIHQIEANLLNPKIYGIAAKIHPVLVIFSLLVGEHGVALADESLDHVPLEGEVGGRDAVGRDFVAEGRGDVGNGRDSP